VLVPSTVMLDELEDDGLCSNCWEAPAVDQSRCTDCLAYFLRNRRDRRTPRQAPTLTPAEELRADAETARRRNLEWLMAGETAPDVDALLEQLVRRPAWHRHAACRGADPELFVPGRGSGRPAEALSYCERCPVRTQCLSSALEPGEHLTAGVWGGTTSLDRRKLRRQEQRRRSVA
jgi:WhiB family redox-sensing transcriptional regulator